MTPTWLLRRGTAPEPANPPTEPKTEPAEPEAESAMTEAESATTEAESATTETEPVEPAPSPAATAEEPPEPGASARTRRPWRIVSAGIAAVLVLAGAAFFHQAHQLTSAAPARNRALTDTEATTRVAGDVGNALSRVFSYTPGGVEAAERSARTVLDGRAARQYATLVARVRKDVTDQRVTLSTRAVRTGVVELDGDQARLLVFLDQTSRRGTDRATTAAAQLTVTARLKDDRWRIVDIKAR